MNTTCWDTCLSNFSNNVIKIRVGRQFLVWHQHKQLSLLMEKIFWESHQIKKKVDVFLFDHVQLTNLLSCVVLSVSICSREVNYIIMLTFFFNLPCSWLTNLFDIIHDFNVQRSCENAKHGWSWLAFNLLMHWSWAERFDSCNNWKRKKKELTITNLTAGHLYANKQVYFIEYCNKEGYKRGLHRGISFIFWLSYVTCFPSLM